MSKRALKKYLNDLSKEQLEEQCLDLYMRFREVKTYYDFVFNPNENKLLEGAKTKIGLEYFPTGKRKRAKMRRSVAQKFIKHFMQIGVDPLLIADLMLFNIEIAQSYRSEKMIIQQAFYISMFRSFEQALKYIDTQGLWYDFRDRAELICKTAEEQGWFNSATFWKAFDRLEGK